jgi:cobalt-zinc-cadmium efflux system outer membrane protein
VQRLELELSRRLATAFQEYSDARFQVTRYTEQIIPRAQETVDLVTRGYPVEIEYLEVLTAQRTLSETSLAHLNAARQLWRSRLRIDGLLLEESLVAAAAED